MPIAILGKDKLATIDALEALLRLTLFPRLQLNQVAGVKEHLDHLRRSPHDLTFGVKFDSSSKPGVTHIEVDLTLGV